MSLSTSKGPESKNALSPGFEAARDVALITEIIAASIEIQPELLDISPTYSRCKAGSSFLVAYEARYENRMFSFYVKALSAETRGKLDKICSRAVVQSEPGPGRIVFKEHGLVIWFFPNDHKLRGLRKIHGATRRIHTLAYKPERRYVGCKSCSDGSRQVIKLYKKSAYSRVCELAAVANRIDFLPDLAGTNAKKQIVKLKWEDGEILAEKFKDCGLDLQMVKKTGELLARLHDTKLPETLTEVSHQAQSGRIEAIARDVGAFHPELLKRTIPLARRLQSLLVEDSPEPVFCHGDFYAKQVLLTGSGVRFLDFDDLKAAPAESDLGLFIAHLEADVLRDRLGKDVSNRVKNLFLTGYLEHRPIHYQRLEVYILWGMFQLAHQPFRDHMPDWQEKMSSWLGEIETRLSAMPVFREFQVPDFRSPRRKPAATLDTLLTASRHELLGHRMVAQAMTESCAGLEACFVLSSDLIRRKAEKRALIRYEVQTAGTQSGQRTVLGKIRTKGLDSATVRFSRALHRSIQSSEVFTPLRVTEPVGEIPALNMWLQEWVDGEDGWVALDAPDIENRAGNLAAALHRFHENPAGDLPEHSIASEIDILQSRLLDAADLPRDLIHRMESLFHRCQSVAMTLKCRPIKCIHRDFYPDQIIYSGDSIYFLDLDLHAAGDIAVDLGNYIAHIEERSIRLFGYPEKHASFCQRLVDSYSKISDDSKLIYAVEVYRILSLARLVQISTLYAYRKAFTLDILKYCEEQIERFESNQV